MKGSVSMLPVVASATRVSGGVKSVGGARKLARFTVEPADNGGFIVNKSLQPTHGKGFVGFEMPKQFALSTKDELHKLFCDTFDIECE